MFITFLDSLSLIISILFSSGLLIFKRYSIQYFVLILALLPLLFKGIFLPKGEIITISLINIVYVMVFSIGAILYTNYLTPGWYIPFFLFVIQIFNLSRIKNPLKLYNNIVFSIIIFFINPIDVLYPHKYI